MTEPEVFILADQSLNNVVNQIKDEQWEMPLPEWFQYNRERQGDLTLRALINYHAYDDAWVPDMLAGRTMDEAGKAKFAGDLLGDDLKGNFAKIVDAACTAARDFTDLDRTVHLTYGGYPAREYFWHINQFRGLRAHDIARLIGAPTELPPELVQGLWDEISPHAEEWRAIGIFPPAVEVSGDAPLQDRLLGLTGRQP